LKFFIISYVNVNSLKRRKDFLASSKVSTFTHAIFIGPDSELIREGICACAKLFVDEENVHMVQIESWKNKKIDGFYTKMTKKGEFSKLCVKIIKKDVIPTYSIFQHVSII
jgi:hypothetical protein